MTRRISGAGAIRDRSSEIFARLARSYRGLMDDYLQQLVVDAPKPIRGMKAIVQELGIQGGGPHDLLDIHLKALEVAAAGVNPTRSEAYSVEGRLLALEMMGLLVDYYTRHDRDIREYVIGANGMSIKGQFQGVNGILAGTPTHSVVGEKDRIGAMFSEAGD